MKNIIGPKQSYYTRHLQSYNDSTVDRAGWEAAAMSVGLQPIELDYAHETYLSPGAQLFILASTLFALGVYSELGQPGANAEDWREKIVT